SYSGRVFRMREHLDRLWDSARAIAIEIPMTMEEMDHAIYATLRENRLDDAYIRLVVTRGVGDLGLNPLSCRKPSVIIITDRIQMYPEEYYENGMELVTVSTVRNHPQSLSPRIKSLNYLNNILAKLEGLKAGCAEALMTNVRGEVAECTGDNIFIVKRGRLVTPPVDAGILEGVTRNFVIELAKTEGIEVAEIPLTKYDMYVADECFLTGTAAEAVPITKLDGRLIGDGRPGPVTQRLLARFRTEVRRQPEV
ncbi:MAG: branched-chain-amino-acid transaminase, partial [Planctomycetia bacterium]|nr:branched-chain-amino-acid transaminase [Planctomycetia bacterium]